MKQDDVVQFIEHSKLENLLLQEGVTDISFNGRSFFVMSNSQGRRAVDVDMKPLEVGSFLRQIANMSEKQFSFSNPILDISFGKYRLNAVFPSIARICNQKTWTFSLRLESKECLIKEGSDFFLPDSEKILTGALLKKWSIVIGGKTSTGKTELQKWLLSQMPSSTRVIVIDNVEELDMVDNPLLDLSNWLVDDGGKFSNFEVLIRNALRNNPDYILLAESRGKETFDAISSAMSGHPIITTIHAKGLEEMPRRMAKMALRAHQGLSSVDILEDIKEHFEVFVYLIKKEIDGRIVRQIESLGVMNPKTGQFEQVLRRKE